MAVVGVMVVCGDDVGSSPLPSYVQNSLNVANHLSSLVDVLNGTLLQRFVHAKTWTKDFADVHGQIDIFPARR